MKDVAKYALYAGTGIVFFLFFLFITFPYDILKNRMVHQIEDTLGSDYHLKIDELSMGVSTDFKGVELKKRKGNDEALLFKLPRLRIHRSFLTLFSALQGNTDVGFHLKAEKGEIEGDYAYSGEEVRTTLHFDEFDLSGIKYLNVFYNLNLTGVIDGDYDLSLAPQDPSKNSGKMDLSFINFKMDPFQIRPSPESVFDLPKTILSGDEKSKLVAEVNSKGELEVKEFSLKGGDVDLFLKGKVVFAPKIEDSKIDLKGKLSLTEKFGQSFPPLILAMFEQQKEEDGSYELQISGPLRKPTNIMIGKFRLPL